MLKFRKNRISEENIKIGFPKSYKDLAKASRGRGASAGPIDPNSQYWGKENLVNTNKWSTGYLKPDGNVSKMKVNNQVASNPIGFYESARKICPVD